VTALPYRLCAFDLDDTLLSTNQVLTERTERAVRAILAQGVVVVLASGRMHESALPFYRRLLLDTPIISYNGALVKHPGTDEEWLHEWVSGEHATLVMDYCQQHNLQLNYYRDDVIYTAALTPWLQLYLDRTRSPYQILPDFYTAMRGLPSTKLIIVDSPEHTDALLPFFQEQLGHLLYITKTTDEYLEFMPPQANKGAALEMVAQRMGISAAETIAFGDGLNDLPMIEWAGLGIAVGNARPALKAVANRVIGRHDEEGVAIALEEIFGL
jgi:Cof subfamily protein (haloacid dehalogenase superfamily)